ncbi:protein TIFY 6B-like [Hibiscus syriacus]|uniref:protein TIFY 6B-like n=1 Tax=Hibiscus syriacus TaxID=106335 RepID=UPI001924F667|nr:protein TIFY 6B-like [Hibiscus syriacus]
MERDFMGLGSKNAPITIKEEPSDAPNDSVLFFKGSGMQLSFSNKAPSVPHLLSFKASQEDRPRKAAHDPPPASGFIAIPTANSYGSTQKLGGNHYSEAHQSHHSRDSRVFPVSGQPNQTITVSMSTPLLQPRLGSTAQNIVGHTVNPQPFTGVPIMAPLVSVVPPSSSIIGTTDLRCAGSAKSSGAPSQLTIFYAGSVFVYDDVSPEKAQAIMLLAGNGSATQSKTAPMTQTQTHDSRPTADAFFRNSFCTMSSFSGPPSHVSVTSHVSLQAGGQCRSINELTAAPRIGALASTSNPPEPPKSVNSVGSAATIRIPTVAVPQARKASLARFLEKRKERVLNMSPYGIC